MHDGHVLTTTQAEYYGMGCGHEVSTVELPHLASLELRF